MISCCLISSQFNLDIGQLRIISPHFTVSRSPQQPSLLIHGCSGPTMHFEFPPNYAKSRTFLNPIVPPPRLIYIYIKYIYIAKEHTHTNQLTLSSYAKHLPSLTYLSGQAPDANLSVDTARFITPGSCMVIRDLKL